MSDDLWHAEAEVLDGGGVVPDGNARRVATLVAAAAVGGLVLGLVIGANRPAGTSPTASPEPAASALTVASVAAEPSTPLASAAAPDPWEIGEWQATLTRADVTHELEDVGLGREVPAVLAALPSSRTGRWLLSMAVSPSKVSVFVLDSPRRGMDLALDTRSVRTDGELIALYTSGTAVTVRAQRTGDRLSLTYGSGQGRQQRPSFSNEAWVRAVFTTPVWTRA